MVKKFFVKETSLQKGRNINEHVFSAKNENNYMFLTTSKFRFLDIKNYIETRLRYDAWYKSIGCKMQKLMLPYEWLDCCKNLNDVGPVGYEEFCSGSKTAISKNECEQL